MKHPGFTRRLALTGAAATAALALWSAAPAHALGQLAAVQVIDRDSGETLPVYRHKGDLWVAGRPGARYAVSVQNSTHGRVLGVVSVDGVNVVSGETASLEQTGYVLSPWQQYQITGWRKSDAEVAAFHFTAAPASYASRTGRPGHVGVIGVAVFREKAPVPAVMAPPPVLREGFSMEQERGAGAGPASAAAKAAEAPSATADAHDSTAPRERDEALASRRMAPAAPAPRLGTGHGAREGAWVGHTTFERRSQRPDEVVRIRYDSRENLVAMGVITAAPVPPWPNPFPGPVQPRYAPDPG